MSVRVYVCVCVCVCVCVLLFVCGCLCRGCASVYVCVCGRAGVGCVVRGRGWVRVRVLETCSEQRALGIDCGADGNEGLDPLVHGGVSLSTHHVQLTGAAVEDAEGVVLSCVVLCRADLRAPERHLLHLVRKRLVRRVVERVGLEHKVLGHPGLADAGAPTLELVHSPLHHGARLLREQGGSRAQARRAVRVRRRRAGGAGRSRR